MPCRGAPGLALLVMTACARTPSPAEKAAAALPVGELPHAANATAGRFQGTTVMRRDTRMIVDGVTVGESDDDLVAALRAKLNASNAAPTDAPATLGLRLPRATPAPVVKRLVDNATLAGYSRVAIAVEAAGAEAHLDVNTSRTPRQYGGKPEADLLFRLDDGKDAIRLIWLEGDQIVSSLDVPSKGAFEQGKVADRVANEWKWRGQHRDPADPRRDLASVSPDDSDDLATIVAAYDAILATTRSFGSTTGPAFSLAFGRMPERERKVEPFFRPSPPKPFKGLLIGTGELAENGHVPAQVIYRIVRQNFGLFTLCYEKGLGRNRALGGEIVVRFTIGADGSVGGISEASTTLEDRAMRQCVTRAFEGLSFPSPRGGAVDVLYPLTFARAPAP